MSRSPEVYNDLRVRMLSRFDSLVGYYGGGGGGMDTMGVLKTVRESQVTELQNVLQRVLDFGENQSLLLCGPRAAGKSHTLYRTINHLQNDNRFRFHTIYVNGVLHGEDDQIALKHIVQQLRPLFSVEGHQLSSADFKSQRDQASFGENLAFLWKAVQRAAELDHSLIIILDEFHEFTLTKTGKPRPKQSLLYNLFDMLQSASVRLGIIGLTTYLDVTDLLEKRIRSRISHRKILFTSYKFDEVMQILRSALRFAVREAKNNVEKQVFLSIDELWSQVSDIIEEQCSLGKRLPFFLNLFRSCISSLGPEIPYFDIELVKKILKAMLQDQNLVLSKLQDLSICELTCVCAMLRFSRRNNSSVNVIQAFNEFSSYSKLVLGASIANFNVQNFSFAFQTLVAKGVIKQLDSTSFSQYSQFELISSVDSFITAVQHLADCPTWISTWIRSAS